MIGILIGLLLGILGYNIGLALEIKCKNPKTSLQELCNKNAPLIKWLSLLASFILVVFGTRDYVRSK